jgi:hypothetical protein
MKVGVRKPSIKRSVKARTTGRIKREVKKAVNPLYGEKGMGWVKDPEKALYNKVYHKTTVGVTDAARVVLSDDLKDSNPINNAGYYNNHESKATPSPKIGMFLIVAGIALIIMCLLLLIVSVVPGLLGIAFGVYCIIKGFSIRKEAKLNRVE